MKIQKQQLTVNLKKSVDIKYIETYVYLLPIILFPNCQFVSKRKICI